MTSYHLIIIMAERENAQHVLLQAQVKINPPPAANSLYYVYKYYCILGTTKYHTPNCIT